MSHRLTVSLSDDWYAYLKQRADREGRTVANLILFLMSVGCNTSKLAHAIVSDTVAPPIIAKPAWVMSYQYLPPSSRTASAEVVAWDGQNFWVDHVKKIYGDVL